MLKRLFLLISMSVAMLLPGALPSGREGEVVLQKQVIRAFYLVALALPPGVPSSRDLDRLAPFLAPELHALLKKAIEAEQMHRGQADEAVPPLQEGALFCSLFEGARSVRAVIQEKPLGPNIYRVELDYDGPGGPKRWQDRVYLVRHQGHWVVGDVAYLGGWAFAGRGRLREVLRAIIRGGGPGHDEDTVFRESR